MSHGISCLPSIQWFKASSNCCVSGIERLLLCVVLAGAWTSCSNDESVAPPIAPVEKPIPDGMVRFQFPLKVGAVWTYSYSSSYGNRSNETVSRTGVQTWTLVSADTIAFPRQFRLQSHEEYNVTSRKLTGSSGTEYRDSSWVEFADVPFTITVGADSIVLHSILRASVLEAERIPRNVYSGQTQVRVLGEGPAGAMSSFEAIYETGKGLKSFSSSLWAMGGSSTVLLWLNSVTVPAL